MRSVIAAFLVLAGLSLAGCASYYQVTDPSTGKTYYSEEVERDDGAVTFVDANTGAEVTLQNTEVKEINKETFRANTPKD